MSRRSRFVAILSGVVTLAAIVVSTAAALAFTDDSCDNTKPCRPPHGVVGSNYSFTLAAMPNTGNGPPYSFVLLSGALPPGLTLASNGPITGKPTQAGTYVFGVELQDNPEPNCIDPSGCPPGVANPFWCKTRGTCAQRDFTITVDPGLSINQQSANPGTVGVVYSEQLTATLLTASPAPPGSPLATATWSISSGALPPGINFGADGLLSGTPTTEGTYTFVVRAELDPQRFDTETETLVVRKAVTVGAITAGRSEVGVPFDADLTATGGTGTFTWSLTAGALPKGVTLAADGSVSGTPRESGRFPFTATVKDTENRTANVNGVLAVAPRITIATKLLRPAKVGKLYRAKLAATGGVIPKVWKVTKGPLPRGVRLDRKTGIISGMPRKAGTYRITVQVTDAFQVVSTRTLRITVVA